jgi:molecular chaperone GrpE
MPEFPPPGISQDASERASQALTPDAISAVLADFRAWLTALLTATNEEASGGRKPPDSSHQGAYPPRSPDLHTLLGQFIAVRQEVNLQTRAVRAQQEQNAETLRRLTTALDDLRQSQARGEEIQEQAIDEAVRPLLKTLINLYDALALAGREMQRLRETVLARREQLDTVTEAPPSRSLFRFFNRRREQELEREREREREGVRQLLASLVTGYTMSLQRIERALREHGLEAIPATGERFDPERMEVLEAVAGSGCPSGEVLEEIRRGYLWNGRVFRYAQVRVAKG